MANPLLVLYIHIKIRILLIQIVQRDAGRGARHFYQHSVHT